MIYIQLLLALLSAVLSVVGLNFWRLSKYFKFGERKCTILIVAGVLSQLGGYGAQVASLKFGPQTLSAVLGAVPIVINPFIEYSLRWSIAGWLLLACGKPPPPVPRNYKWRCGKAKRVLVLFLLVSGLSLTATSFFLAQGTQAYDPTAVEVYNLVTRLASLVVLSVVVFVAFLLVVARFGTSNRVKEVGVLSVAAGLFTGVSGVCIKSALHMLGAGYAGEVTIFAYFGAVFGVMQIFCTQLALSRHPPELGTQLQVTLFETTNMLTTLLCGGFIYEEYLLFAGATEWATFGVGIGLTLVALCVWGFADIHM